MPREFISTHGTVKLDRSRLVSVSGSHDGNLGGFRQLLRLFIGGKKCPLAFSVTHMIE